MAESMEENDLSQANFRLCRLRVWPNYDGLGFHLKNASIPPHIIRTVESNSPAAAGGLKILDLILAVDNQDVSTADFITVTQAIKNARDSNDRIELRVIEKCFYREFKSRGYSFNPRLARIIETPTAMSRDYMNFPKYTPRTCEIHLSQTDQSFGFEVIGSIKNIGAFIQEVFPNTPASRTTLRKCDRILEIDDKFVDNQASKYIFEKLYKAKKKRSVKLYVVDTNTYKYFQENRTPLKLKKFRKSKFAKQQSPTSTYTNSEDKPTIRVTTRVPVEEPSPGITGLVNSNSIQPRMSIENSQSNRRNYKLFRIPGCQGYGFSVNSNQGNSISHKITQIAPYSPAEQQGLRVGDYILTVNDKNVEKMNASDFNQFLRTSVQNAETHKNPLLLQVINEDFYKPSTLLDDVSTRHSATDPLSTPTQPMISPDGNRKSTINQPTSSHNENQKLRINQPYMNDHSSTPRDRFSRSEIRLSETSSSREHLFRGTVDIVPENRLLRYSPLNVEPSQPFDFQLNPDPNDNCHGLKTANSRVLVDTKSVRKLIQNQKVHNSGNNKQFDSKPTDVSIERNRKFCTPVKKENDVVYYSDDWDSDYSDNWKVDSNDERKPAAIRRPFLSESKTSNNAIKLVPSDTTAFEASFCRKRQEAIDNMSYRQAINSWAAKRLHDVVRLIIDLSKDKSLIDRAWIIFYWVSQNIEYDVEAYFSGNIPHQTSEDIFASGKGVCDAFGTIFETLCNAVQVECKKISGYAKGYSFKVGQKSFARTNHAWNVIRLEGHWYLVDPTWGEGFLDTNKCNRKKLNPFYFLVRPEQMIYMHLPEDSKWQLLMPPISMEEFIHLPYVKPTFFEHNLNIVYPHHSNRTSFNSSLGLSEVLVRAPSDVTLMGDIKETGSGKIKTGSLVQYDADRQLWQCLFAPQCSGFHTLTIFSRREKQIMKSKTDESEYSCAIEFSLHVPTDIVKTKIFPLTYCLFTERKCQIFEPPDSALKFGSEMTIHCRIPGAYCARLLLDGNWLSEDLLKDGIFKRQITIPQREISMYVKFSDKRDSSSYDGLFCYSIK